MSGSLDYTNIIRFRTLESIIYDKNRLIYSKIRTTPDKRPSQRRSTV